jgi:hypothetical protein
MAVASVLSMTTVGSFLGLALWVLASVDGATGSAFNGFSSDGARYLVGKDQICEPLGHRAGSGTPRCEKVTDRQALKALGIQKPRRQRKSSDGALRLVDEIVDERKIVVRGIPASGAAVELVAWDAGAPVAVVKGLAPSADDGALAIEYVLRGQNEVRVVAFRLRAAAAPVVVAPSKGVPTARAVGKWEQRQVPCDQAGVTLGLTAKGKFDLTIATKCQGEKWTTKLDGTWSGEGDSLLLVFQNEEGPEEKLQCGFVTCDGRECLQCTLDDVTFLLTHEP